LPHNSSEVGSTLHASIESNVFHTKQSGVSRPCMVKPDHWPLTCMRTQIGMFEDAYIIKTVDTDCRSQQEDNTVSILIFLALVVSFLWVLLYTIWLQLNSSIFPQLPQTCLHFMHPHSHPHINSELSGHSKSCWCHRFLLSSWPLDLSRLFYAYSAFWMIRAMGMGQIWQTKAREASEAILKVIWVRKAPSTDISTMWYILPTAGRSSEECSAKLAGFTLIAS